MPTSTEAASVNNSKSSSGEGLAEVSYNCPLYFLDLQTARIWILWATLFAYLVEIERPTRRAATAYRMATGRPRGTPPWTRVDSFATPRPPPKKPCAYISTYNLKWEDLRPYLEKRFPGYDIRNVSVVRSNPVSCYDKGTDLIGARSTITMFVWCQKNCSRWVQLKVSSEWFVQLISGLLLGWFRRNWVVTPDHGSVSNQRASAICGALRGERSSGISRRKLFSRSGEEEIAPPFHDGVWLGPFLWQHLEGCAFARLSLSTMERSRPLW